MYITNKLRTDGFGAQYQTILFTIMYAELHNLEFVYTPFTHMEHNYDDDVAFLDKKENLIKIRDNYKSVDEIGRDKLLNVDLSYIYRIVEDNLDYCTSLESYKKAKNLFYNCEIPREEKTISIHIRRPNKYDIGDYGYTNDQYYVNTLDIVLKKYPNTKKIKIYSQGDVKDFSNFTAFDPELHLNESIEDTFKGLVFTDVLIMSKGSFSYCAGLLCSGEVYYLPFWHKPKSNWIII